MMEQVELASETPPLDMIFKARSIEGYLADDVELEFIREDEIFERESTKRGLSDRLLALYQRYQNLSVESRAVQIEVLSDDTATLLSQVTVRARNLDGISRTVEIYTLSLDYRIVDKEWLIRQISLTQITPSTGS